MEGFFLVLFIVWKVLGRLDFFSGFRGLWLLSIRVLDVFREIWVVFIVGDSRGGVRSLRFSDGVGC